MPAVTLDASHHRLAVSAGEAWASAFADDLRSRRRAVAGGWPGTMTEARARVLATVTARGVAVSVEQLRELARTAYDAARAAWLAVSERDVDD
jgi:hypothetical protein